MKKRAKQKMTWADWLFGIAMCIAFSTGNLLQAGIIAFLWEYRRLAQRVQLLEARGGYEKQNLDSQGVQKMQ